MDPITIGLIALPALAVLSSARRATPAKDKGRRGGRELPPALATQPPKAPPKDMQKGDGKIDPADVSRGLTLAKAAAGAVGGIPGAAFVAGGFANSALANWIGRNGASQAKVNEVMVGSSMTLAGFWGERGGAALADAVGASPEQKEGFSKYGKYAAADLAGAGVLLPTRIAADLATAAAEQVGLGEQAKAARDWVSDLDPTRSDTGTGQAVQAVGGFFKDLFSF